MPPPRPSPTPGASRAPEPTAALLAKNTGLNLLGFGLPLVVALVAVPLLLAGLGEDRFGLLALAWMFIAVFGEVGFGRAATRFMAEVLGEGRSGDIGATARLVIGAQLVLGILAGGALALIAPVLVGQVLGVPEVLREEAAAAFFLVAVAIPIAMMAGVLRGTLEAAQRFDLVNIVRVLVSTGSFLFPLVALWLGWGLVGVTALLLAGRAGATLAYGALVVRVFPSVIREPGSGGRTPLRALLGYGGWVSASSVATQILANLDRLLLGTLVSVAAVGIYTAPYELVTRLVLIPGSLAATLFPAFSTLHGMGRGEESGRLLARGSRYVMASVGLAVTLLAAGAEPILSLWLGGAYTPEAASALRLLGVGVLASAMALLPFSLLQGVGRADVPGKLHLVQIPFYAAFAWVLIARWGIAGAASAWTIRALADAGLLYYAAARLTPGAFRAEFARVAATAVCMILVGGALAALVRVAGSGFGALPVLFAGGGVLLALLWRISLDGDERARIVGWLRRARA